MEFAYVIAGRPLRIPKSYERILDAYYLFGKDICQLNFDQTAKEQIYVWESFGRKRYESMYGSSRIDSMNGYYHGKSWMDVTIAMWKEDLKNGLLSIDELLYDDFIMKKLR